MQFALTPPQVDVYLSCSYGFLDVTWTQNIPFSEINIATSFHFLATKYFHHIKIDKALSFLRVI